MLVTAGGKELAISSSENKARLHIKAWHTSSSEISARLHFVASITPHFNLIPSAFELGGGFSFLDGKIELATWWFSDLILFELAALSLSACTISVGCHTRFKKDNRTHLICAPGSSSTHMIDVTSDYSINVI
jgi:hypothetical protein